MATTTPPKPNMHKYRAASTLLPVYLADANAVVIVTPAVTTAARTYGISECPAFASQVSRMRGTSTTAHHPEAGTALGSAKEGTMKLHRFSAAIEVFP